MFHVKLVNWKDEKTPVALDVLYLEQGRKGTSAIESEFVVHINPGDLGKLVDIAIGNNGSYICDATALRLRIYAGDERYETPGVDVTKKVQSVFQGKFRTDLGKYADLFGDPAPGQEKTLKLRVQDMSGQHQIYRIARRCPNCAAMTSRIACLDATLVAAEDRGLRHLARDKALLDTADRGNRERQAQCT